MTFVSFSSTTFIAADHRLFTAAEKQTIRRAQLDCLCNRPHEPLPRTLTSKPAFRNCHIPSPTNWFNSDDDDGSHFADSKTIQLACNGINRNNWTYQRRVLFSVNDDTNFSHPALLIDLNRDKSDPNWIESIRYGSFWSVQFQVLRDSTDIVLLGALNSALLRLHDKKSQARGNALFVLLRAGIGLPKYVVDLITAFVLLGENRGQGAYAYCGSNTKNKKKTMPFPLSELMQSLTVMRVPLLFDLEYDLMLPRLRFRPPPQVCVVFDNNVAEKWPDVRNFDPDLPPKLELRKHTLSQEGIALLHRDTLQRRFTYFERQFFIMRAEQIGSNNDTIALDGHLTPPKDIITCALLVRVYDQHNGQSLPLTDFRLSSYSPVVSQGRSPIASRHSLVDDEDDGTKGWQCFTFAPSVSLDRALFGNEWLADECLDFCDANSAFVLQMVIDHPTAAIVAVEMHWRCVTILSIQNGGVNPSPLVS